MGAVHTDAPRPADTDWRQIVALCDQLYAITPTPVVALNRAVALAEVDGPDAGLAALERAVGLEAYHAYQASLADLLRRAGRDEEAREAYAKALQLTENPGERAFLRGRRPAGRGLSGRSCCGRSVACGMLALGPTRHSRRHP